MHAVQICYVLAVVASATTMSRFCFDLYLGLLYYSLCQAHKAEPLGIARAGKKFKFKSSFKWVFTFLGFKRFWGVLVYQKDHADTKLRPSKNILYTVFRFNFLR